MVEVAAAQLAVCKPHVPSAESVNPTVCPDLWQL